MLSSFNIKMLAAVIFVFAVGATAIDAAKAVHSVQHRQTAAEQLEQQINQMGQ